MSTTEERVEEWRRNLGEPEDDWSETQRRVHEVASAMFMTLAQHDPPVTNGEVCIVLSVMLNTMLDLGPSVPIVEHLKQMLHAFAAAGAEVQEQGRVQN